MSSANGLKLNGPALREIRMAKGRSVSSCAEEVDVSQGTWSNWEAGRRRATPENVQRITEVLLIQDVRSILWPSTTTTVTVTQAADPAA